MTRRTRIVSESNTHTHTNTHTHAKKKKRPWMYFSHFVLISAQIGFGGFACFVTTDFRLLAVGKKKKSYPHKYKPALRLSWKFHGNKKRRDESTVTALEERWGQSKFYAKCISTFTQTIYRMCLCKFSLSHLIFTLNDSLFFSTPHPPMSPFPLCHLQSDEFLVSHDSVLG